VTTIERLIAYGVILVMLVIGVPWYFEHRGAAECKAEDKTAVATQEAHNAAQAVNAAVTIAQEDKTHDEALLAPVITSPTLNCVRTYQGRTVLPATKPASISNGPADSPKPNSQPVGDDPSSDLKAIGRAADAQIVELQDYIKNVCLVK